MKGNSQAQTQDKHTDLSRFVQGSQKEAREFLRHLLANTGGVEEKKRRQKGRDAILKRLDHVVRKLEKSRVQDVAEPRTSRTDQDDFSAHASDLYKVLLRYSTCDAAGPEAEIVPKISLNGYRKHEVSGSSFDVLFPNHPHGEGQWQNAVIQIPGEV